MKREASRTIRALLIELPIYAVLVVTYFLLVLHFLGDWLDRLFKEHLLLYSCVALALVIGQALVLDWVTLVLLRLLRRRAE
ncbi:MAG: hypothetical protein ACJ8KU_02695 [Chthoniobacterales bacterium]